MAHSFKSIRRSREGELYLLSGRQKNGKVYNTQNWYHVDPMFEGKPVLNGSNGELSCDDCAPQISAKYIINVDGTRSLEIK